ncbi:MAG TPA: enoyl-CoA hydratase/isomerase family protein [Acidimicrobiales bacterium]|nr:enoyl-CoA hydratase/isomerase family protein [Acidimicrobiales bacterium]
MSSTEEPILLEVDDDGVATVTLNRPDKLNIYNLRMRDGLIEALAALRVHPGARAVVLRAEGRHFSAGADLAEFGTAESILDARRIRWERDPWVPLWTLPRPTVVALHGYALGAGLEMALLCDVRLAAGDTVVGLPETRLGMLPSAGGTQSLPRAIAAAPALPIVLTGERLDAQDALARGLVHRVVDDVEAEARRVAARLARLPTGAVSAAKRALRAAGDLALPAGLAEERRLAELVAAQPPGASAVQVSIIDDQGSSPVG